MLTLVISKIFFLQWVSISFIIRKDEIYSMGSEGGAEQREESNQPNTIVLVSWLTYHILFIVVERE